MIGTQKREREREKERKRERKARNKKEAENTLKDKRSDQTCNASRVRNFEEPNPCVRSSFEDEQF
jgi:hypothetical protein